jgi:hypothetical protein
MTMDTKWREILEQVERGEMTPEQGAELLAAQTRQFDAEADQPQTNRTPAGQAGGVQPQPPVAGTELVEDFNSALSSWKNWWMLPLLAGILICAFSGLAMSSAVSSERMFWFYCSIIPAMLGAIVVILSIWSRKSRWVHVRVRDAEGGRKKNVNISLPIPTNLVGWVLHTFGHQIPGLREQPEVIRMMPEMMKALEESGDPLVVEVNDKDGSEVRVYIM